MRVNRNNLFNFKNRKMNKNKFYTIGLIAGSLFATSCDDMVDCGCNCNMPQFDKWEILKAGEQKNDDGTVSSGTAIVVWGKNLTNISEISFNGLNAELQPAFMEDSKIIFQIPEGISEDCVAHVRTAGCEQGIDVDLLKVVVAPPCVSMCDNEMAEKSIKVIGNSLFAPLTAKFWDGESHTIEASTENGMITIDDANHATITIPEGVKDGGTIVFVSNAGESETNFRFRDTRNMLITHDDEEYLNLFNQDKPDIDLENKADLIAEGGAFYSENNTSNYSIFWSNLYTAWSYSPKGEANPEGKAPKYTTPFGYFSDEIIKGASFNDYVIKFEVFVPAEYPMNGNGLAIGFYNSDWAEVREYCAFWQPSKATFGKDADGVWQATCTCENWTTGGDWLTITIPMEELRYNFMAKNYFCSAQNDRKITDGSDSEYAAYGDSESGLPLFDYNPYDLSSSKVKPIQSIAFIYGSDDQPNAANEPMFAVDNLRITPKDNNGGVFPLLKWGQPTRDFYLAPTYSCK